MRHETWDWDELLLPYRQAVREVCVKFEAYTTHNEGQTLSSAIEAVEGRVKRVSSILEKASRKKIQCDSFDDMAEQVMDIAGIRIICRFEEDIGRVAALIRSRHEMDMHILDERDYINNIKKSGYRSYHMHIKYAVMLENGPREVIAEIQIRTMAMNVWAATEHSLKYKYSGELPENLRQRLFKSAEAAFLLDREMSVIRDEVMEVRRLIEQKYDLGDEILRNLKALHAHNPTEKVAELGREFLTILEDNDISPLHDFNQRLKIMTHLNI